MVLIRPGGAQADASILFFNADGSETESCFNATRCVARLLLDEGPDAYKDIEQVMREQADLVEIVHELQGIVNYKGL